MSKVDFSNDSAFSQNSATIGGAIYNEGSITFSGDQNAFSGNTASFGGAIATTGNIILNGEPFLREIVLMMVEPFIMWGL